MACPSRVCPKITGSSEANLDLISSIAAFLSLRLAAIFLVASLILRAVLISALPVAIVAIPPGVPAASAKESYAITPLSVISPSAAICSDAEVIPPDNASPAKAVAGRNTVRLSMLGGVVF